MRVTHFSQKLYQTINIDIEIPNFHDWNNEKQIFKDLYLMFDPIALKMKGHFEHGGRLWFSFDLIKKGLHNISFLAPRYNINYHVMVTVE